MLSSAVFPSPPRGTLTSPLLDRESQGWVDRLTRGSAERDATMRALHGLLLKAARFEVNRRRATTDHVRRDEHDDLAHQSADDPRRRPEQAAQFRGDSRFTTWALPFALFEAAVKTRRRSWHGREAPLAPTAWNLPADAGSTPQHARRGVQDHPRCPTRPPSRAGDAGSQAARFCFPDRLAAHDGDNPASRRGVRRDDAATRTF
jgi:hypothetical protein